MGKLLSMKYSRIILVLLCYDRIQPVRCGTLNIFGLTANGNENKVSLCVLCGSCVIPQAGASITECQLTVKRSAEKWDVFIFVVMYCVISTCVNWCRFLNQ